MVRRLNLSAGNDPHQALQAPSAHLKRVLDRFVRKTDPASLVANDPVELVRAYDRPHDQEVAGILVAVLAYGRVASIRAKAKRALQQLGPHPADAVDAGDTKALSGFVYRFQRGDDVVRFLAAVARVRKAHGSLAAAFLAATKRAPQGAHYGLALGHFVDELTAAVAGELTPGLRFLLPNPGGGGAAKRLCLYLRWMIRPAGPLDLGTWQVLAPGVSPARLVIPLDVHIHRLGQYIGLTRRRTADLTTAVEITAALTKLRPRDPLVYDMALCHLGISGRCPHARDVVLCSDCPVQEVCRLGPEPKGWPYR